MYIIGIIVFSIVLVVCIFLLIYFTMDEKKLKEVSDSNLLKLGKTYSKKDFEDNMFNQYRNILESINYSNYSFLKDSVSDQIYNEILLKVKNDRDNNQNSIISNIKKDFSKLISLEVKEDLEIAKLWIKYSSVEYTKTIRKLPDGNGNVIDTEVITSGNKDVPINHEFILTFVKNYSSNEDVVCPSCGFQTHMLTNSKCARCDSEIVPKKMHWVFVEKVNTNTSKQN